MRAVKRSTALVVHPRSSWRHNAMLSLSAFGLTVATVYFTSHIKFSQLSQEKGSKAIASIELKPAEAINNLPVCPIMISSLDINKIKARIYSTGFILLALRECGLDLLHESDNARKKPIISPDQLCLGLCVRIAPKEITGGNQIILELCLPESSDAPKIVRAIANRFVREYQTYWAFEARKTYFAALAQANQAQQSHREAKEKLQSFQDNLSKTLQIQPEQPSSNTETAKQIQIQDFDNPAWIELNSKLASLRSQEENMLVNKTPFHPAVQQVKSDIADIQEQMAFIPRMNTEIFMTDASQKTVSKSMAEKSTLENEIGKLDKENNKDISAGSEQTATTAMLKQLQDEVKRTEQGYLEKFRYEQQLFEASRRQPILSVDVRSIAIANTEPKSNRGLIELMFFSGFAMALGISVFTSGVTSEPVLATIGDMEPLVSAPIIGVVPGHDQSFDPSAHRRRQLIFRWGLILFGGLIVLSSIVVVYWFLTHLG